MLPDPPSMGMPHNLPTPYRTCRGTCQLPIGPGIIGSLVTPLVTYNMLPSFASLYIVVDDKKIIW